MVSRHEISVSCRYRSENMAEKETTKMKLYYFPLYRSCRNIWLIKELGVEAEVEYIHNKPSDDEAANAAYRKDVHPHGTIPALVLPGDPAPMLESGAICMYLADKYGKLVPEPQDRKDYYDFIMYGNTTVDEMMEFFYELWILKQDKSDADVQKWKDKFHASMAYLSRRLEGREFLCGDKFTAADCVLGHGLDFFSTLRDGELLNNHPAIKAYLARLQKRPAFKETYEMK